ncbi:MAG: dimethyl sulfoxide reductase anchor subunit family protein [Coriobacteriia bacterium]
MSSLKPEWPLLVFSTCALLSSGAWIVAAVLALSGAFPQAYVLVTGLPGIFLCVLLAVGLAFSTLHLGKPLKALRAFTRLGNSTVSNEVFIGTLFLIVSVLFVALSQWVPVGGELWGVLLFLVAALAAAFIAFQCLAHRMRTVATWNSRAFSLEFAVIALLGGLCLEGVIASVLLPVPFDVRAVLALLEFVCCAALALTVSAQGIVVAKSVSGRRNSATVLKEWGTFAVARVAIVVIGSLSWALGLLSQEPVVVLAVAGFAIVVFGVVLGRYSFYRSYVTVGLPRV